MGRTSARYRLPAQSAPAIQLPDLSRQNAVNARLAQFPLENEARQAQIDRVQASEAKARYELSKQIETDRQKTAFYNGLQELESNLNQRGVKIGSQEHAEAFAAYAHEFPLARSTKSVQDTLKVHALVADDQAALAQRMKTSMDAGRSLGLQPEGASFIKGGNVDVRFRQGGNGNVPQGALMRYARIQGNIDQNQAALQADIARQEKINIDAKKANVPYNASYDDVSRLVNSNLAGYQREAEVLQNRFPDLSKYDQAAADTGTQDQTAQQTTAIPSATPAQTPNTVAPSPTVQPSATPDQTPIYTPSPSPEATATPTPIHLGRYNPETGEFE